MPVVNPFAVVVGIFFLILVAKAAVIIPENQRAGVVRLGRYFKTLGPGLNLKVPFIDQVTPVDLDASIPGWQGMTERELSAAVESFVMVRSVTGEKLARSRSATPSGSVSGAAEEQALAAWLVKTASAQVGADLSNDRMAKDRIAESARGAVEALRSSGSFEISLPFLTADRSGPKHFSLTLTGSRLDEILGSGRG